MSLGNVFSPLLSSGSTQKIGLDMTEQALTGTYNIKHIRHMLTVPRHLPVFVMIIIFEQIG